MRNIYYLFKKELKTYFISPIAYIVLLVFTFLSGIFFTTYVSAANNTDLSSTFNNVTIIFFFIIPLITMRLIAEEKKNGTFELLQTSPLSPIEIVLGKYFAACTLMLIMISMLFLFPLFMLTEASIYWPVVLVQLSGLFFLGSALIAIGIALSSFTSSQLTAAIISFAVMLGLLLLSWLSGYTNGILRTIINELTIINHLDSFLKGVLTLKDIIYYLVWIVFAIFLANKSIESYSWRG